MPLPENPTDTATRHAAIERALSNANLPSPSPVIQRLAELSDSDATPLAEIASLIRRDPALTARVTSVACSAAFAGDRPLSGLEQCLARLGTRLIRSMTLCLGVQRLLEPLPATLRPVLDAFWAHSLCMAELAADLARLTGQPQSDALYLAGLLHDVGPFILLSAEGETYHELLAQCADESQLASREQASLGLDHRQLPSALLDHWGLADGPGDALIGLHASTAQIASAPPPAQVLWLAHALLAAPPEIEPSLIASAVPQLGLGGADLVAAIERARQQVKRLGDGLGWQLPDAPAASQWMQQLFMHSPAPAAEIADSALAASVGFKAVLQPLATQLGDSASPDQLWLILREAAGILFNLRQMAILDIDPAEDCLDGRAYPSQPAALAQRLPLAGPDNLVRRALRNDQVESIFPGKAANASLTDLQFARALRSPGLLALPMRRDGHLLGLLVFGILPADLERKPALLPRLAAFASVCAQALAEHASNAAARALARSTAEEEFLLRGRRLAHEAGNPLGIIQTYLLLLGRRLHNEAETAADLNVLRGEIDRVTQILDRLSAVPDHASDAACDLGQVLGDLIRLYRTPLFDERGIRLELVGGADAGLVACPRDSLVQLLLNLLKNASEALSRGNQLRLDVASVLSQGRPQVELTLSDDGPGLPERALQSLNMAAPQTLGGKRGHGLALVAQLARQHGIALSVRSAPAHGTRLTLHLPVAPRPLETSAA